MISMSYQPKIALIHDDFTQLGGAESLFATIASIFPDAPIYTSLANWQKVPKSIEQRRIVTSFIQKIPFAAKFYKTLLPLYPLAFESFDFSKYDLVLSSTTRFAKAIITRPKTTHISYLNSVPRFLWEDKINDYLPSLIFFLFKPILNWLKKWDKASAQRVDFYIANSQNVARKIKKIYSRDSQVIYPFANTNFYTIAKIHNWELKNQNYYLVVTRLVKWKRVDIAISAALSQKLTLFIVGEGPNKSRLQKLASSSQNIKFFGKVTKGQLRQLYRNCQALIVTQEEDFGIAAVEAQSCGKPVITYKSGGTEEIIIEGKTGVFFDYQNKEALKDAIERASRVKWNEAQIRKNALKFSRESFVKSLKDTVRKPCPNHQILR